MSGPAQQRPVALEIAVSLDATADKLLQALRELRELTEAQRETVKAQRWLTERFSKCILEHGIHAELERFEKERARSRRFYRGWPGVPEKVVRHV